MSIYIKDPKLTEPQLVFCNQGVYRRYVHELKDGGALIYLVLMFDGDKESRAVHRIYDHPDIRAENTVKDLHDVQFIHSPEDEKIFTCGRNFVDESSVMRAIYDDIEEFEACQKKKN